MSKAINVSAAMSIKKITASDTDENIFTFAAAKVGSKSFGSDGTKYTFTKASLMECAESFNDGILTLNHEVLDDGKITSAWFDDSADMLMMTVSADNDETARRMRDGEATGVSIEASIIDVNSDNEIFTFDGTGVGVMFYPVQPACPLVDGCGILAKDQFEEKSVKITAKRLTQIKSSEYDLARINDSGDLVKIGNVYIWDENNESDSEIEGQIASYTSYYGTGDYTYLESSDTRLGDTVSGDALFTASIDVSKTSTESFPAMGGNMAKEDPTAPTVLQSDYDDVVAKSVEMAKELAELKTDEGIKARDASITAKDAEIESLKADISARDTEIALTLIDEIKAWDADFVIEEGVALTTIQTIHASLKRIADKADKEDITASEKDELVKAGTFTAPVSPSKTAGLTIGGIVNGQWVGGRKEV